VMVIFLVGFVIFIYGMKRDDARLIIGLMIMGLGFATSQKSYNTYLCDGVEGVQEAHRTGKRRWTLSNGESYHRIDFYKKCRKVAPPGLLDAQ